MKILFAATPGHGHVNPLLALVRMVRHRGDEPIFATGSHLADAVAASGATFIPLAARADFDPREVDKRFPERAGLPPGPELVRFDLEQIFIRTMASQASTLKAAIAAYAPDVIVTDMAFMGRVPLFLDTSRLRPPIAVCGITGLMLPRADGAPFGLGLPPARDDAERQAYARVAADFEAALTGPLKKVFDAELADLGLPPLPCSMAEANILTADAYLQANVPAFDYAFDPLPSHISFIGALPPVPIPGLPQPDWWNDLDGSRRVVLVTQGTIANADFSQLVEPTLAALADRSDLLVIVTTCRRPLDSLKGPIPANTRVATLLDLEQTLPKVDVLVTNGGYGTVSQALRAGKPIVAAGRTEDKAEVGARVAWSGVGVEIPSQTPTVEELRVGICRVLETPSYRARAEATAAEMAAIDTQAEVFRTLDLLVDRARVLS